MPKDLTTIALDKVADELGDLTDREYNILRIGMLVTMFAASSERKSLEMPGIIRESLSNELAFRWDRVTS
jgi:hypothetical protein